MEGTRDRIISEALRLFSEKGYGEVTVSQIAESVGIKPPALYKHFQSKQDIFDAIKSFIWGTSSSDKGHKKVVNPNAKENRERWITLSACRSDQVNVEMKSPAVGKLTYALWKELKNSDKVNNDEFMRRIRKFVNRNTSSRPQQPEMTGEDINKYNITDILSR